MIFKILFAVSLVANVVFTFVTVRFVRRLFQFDELFSLLVDDIDVNVRFFKKLLATPLFDNSQEVRTANNNMMIISQRLEEFANRIGEVSNRNSSPEDKNEEV